MGLLDYFKSDAAGSSPIDAPDWKSVVQDQTLEFLKDLQKRIPAFLAQEDKTEGKQWLNKMEAPEMAIESNSMLENLYLSLFMDYLQYVEQKNKDLGITESDAKREFLDNLLTVTNKCLESFDAKKPLVFNDPNLENIWEVLTEKLKSTFLLELSSQQDLRQVFTDQLKPITERFFNDLQTGKLFSNENRQAVKSSSGFSLKAFLPKGRKAVTSSIPTMPSSKRSKKLGATHTP